MNNIGINDEINAREAKTKEFVMLFFNGKLPAFIKKEDVPAFKSCGEYISGLSYQEDGNGSGLIPDTTRAYLTQKGRDLLRE